MTAARVRCYAVRRANPFMGVTQVVATPDARALSANGVLWELQVLAERPETLWGSVNAGRSVRQYFRFGLWSAEEGVSRVPINPILNVGEMLSASDELIEALEARLSDIPFPTGDRYELWLLDSERLRPLALLATAEGAEHLAAIRLDAWQATTLSERSFVSPTLTQGASESCDLSNPRWQAAALEAVVKDAAGRPPVAQWFEREGSGRGVGLPHRVAPPLAERVLGADDFPELLIREAWPSPDAEALVADYIAWCAPRLLALDNLSDRTRARLEPLACRQPLLVDTLYRLYPRVVDRELLDRARVEARLRRAS
jgi:hypothetical protein